jgi:hypothetical protein
MFLKLYNSHRTTFGCNGDGWRYEEISILSFFLPMLEWGKLVIHESFVVMACAGRCQGFWYFPHLCYSTILHCQMRSIFEKWSYLYYQHGICVLIMWRNQLALFGKLFCNFVVINIWLFLWHIQDMLAWCTCKSPFRWWPPFWFCHPWSWIFWCTFLSLSIVTRFWQQPFEIFEPTHLDMNVLTID